MYVRDAKNREEVWLLDSIEAFGLDDAAFRSRDYVVAVDEHNGDKAGFGRIRIHKTEQGEFCELTSVGVLPAWRGQGVGAHVIERLIEHARDEGFERVYLFTPAADYATQLGFEPVESADLPAPMAERLETVRAREGESDAVALTLAVEAFAVPERLRERFKNAAPDGDDGPDGDPDEQAEDFGIDTDQATYKYDV
ncbi:GNAT family N-acetyltransferase [Salinarchaeum chitinilyticum]